MSVPGQATSGSIALLPCNPQFAASLRATSWLRREAGSLQQRSGDADVLAPAARECRPWRSSRSTISSTRAAQAACFISASLALGGRSDGDAVLEELHVLDHDRRQRQDHDRRRPAVQAERPLFLERLQAVSDTGTTLSGDDGVGMARHCQSWCPEDNPRQREQSDWRVNSAGALSSAPIDAIFGAGGACAIDDQHRRPAHGRSKGADRDQGDCRGSAQGA